MPWHEKNIYSVGLFWCGTYRLQISALTGLVSILIWDGSPLHVFQRSAPHTLHYSSHWRKQEDTLDISFAAVLGMIVTSVSYQAATCRRVTAALRRAKQRRRRWRRSSRCTQSSKQSAWATDIRSPLYFLRGDSWCMCGHLVDERIPVYKFFLGQEFF